MRRGTTRFLNLASPCCQHYGDVGLTSQMLHRASSAAAFARNADLRYPPGHRWCYHSAATNLLSELLEKSFVTKQEYWQYPFTKLFEPLGASSFVMETDWAGHFVGSSYRCGETGRSPPFLHTLGFSPSNPLFSTMSTALPRPETGQSTAS